jgi:hypothetical protein
MKLSRSLILVYALVPLAFLTTPLSAKKNDTNSAAGAAVVTRVYTTAETADFKKLAQATLDALSADKHTEMVAKLTDLETAWDDHEETLKSRDVATWTTLDKTLDKAISSLRSSHTDPVKGKAALTDLLAKLDQATKQ